MTVAERLKSLREQKDYTMEYVAKALNVAQQTYFKYEHGIIVNIPIDKVEILARLFGVSESYIMGWSNKEQENDNELLSLYHQLDSDDKDEIIDVIKLKLSRKKDTLPMGNVSV